MNLSTQHLPADLFSLTPLVRRALSEGAGFAHLPTVQRPSDIPIPEERHDLGERSLLVEAIESKWSRQELPAAARSALQALGESGTTAVITGQQPGLLCSPLYSFYKAIQAVKLAQDLSQAWQRKVVAVFWNHADDHDVAEVHHAWQLNANLDLQKTALAGLSSGRHPIGDLKLSEEQHRLGALRASLGQMYGDHAHIEAALDLFLPREGETLASAFTRAFTQLLGPHGLIVVEPDWIRPELSRALAHVVGRNPMETLLQRSNELEADGLSVAIDPSQAALVFQHRERGRFALRAGGDGFRFEQEEGSRTPTELAAEIVETPAHWSAGALLRPLAQDYVFPTAAYVGGLGELVYHAQLGPTRLRSDLPVLSFVPRVSCTLVDAATRVSLNKLECEVRDVLAARGQLELEEDGAGAPPVLAELRSIAQRAAAELLEQRSALSALDKGLAINLKRTASQVRDTVEKIAVKGDRVFANQSGKGKRHVRRVQNALFPRESPQERILGPLPYYSRYGPAWVDALLHELPSTSLEHLVMEIEDDAESVVAKPAESTARENS